MINTLINKLKKEGIKAFIPYITAGDPDLSATEKFVRKFAINVTDVDRDLDKYIKERK